MQGRKISYAVFCLKHDPCASRCGVACLEAAIHKQATTPQLLLGAFHVASPTSRFLFPARRFTPLSASAFACDFSELQKGTVAEVKDGETLTLTDGTTRRRRRASTPRRLPVRS